MVDGNLTLEMVQASQVGLKAIGAGIAVGLTGLGTGLAEYAIGSAAVGATAETIVIFGLVVGLLLLF
jgi:V/A-type H+-transporting ATPase subunit K